MCQQCDCKTETHDPSIKQLFDNNALWVEERMAENPSFFNCLSQQQTPEYLWIGCSDSRVPANELVKMDPGTIFVHRNIANLVNSSDMNVLAVIQYAVQVLKVKHIIVNGHYGCGGVIAAMNDDNPDLIEHWIRPIRKYYQRAQSELDAMPEEQRFNRLCEINVVEQVFNVCHVPAVRNAWKKGQELSVHGFIYDIKDGCLHDMGISISDLESAEQAVLRAND